MSFYDVVQSLKEFDFQGYFDKVSEEDVKKTLAKEKLTENDFLNLLSPAALPFLEEMATRAHQLTVQYFGRTIGLYMPIYIANYCTNECIYCGFNKNNKIKRKKLSLLEIEEEAIEIAKSGIKHILVLTGEAEGATPEPYLIEAIEVMKRHFSSVSIEMFPMDVTEYHNLKLAGVDGLTVYQEVYDEKIYKKVHLSGRKADYRYRLDTPERGAEAGFRAVNIGTLFGLGELRREAFISGLHAKYLDDKYIDTEISLSLPRINEAEGGFKAYHPIDDRTYVQFMLAFRLFLPRIGINISTRETAEFRDNLINLGVTKFSAGSKTEVGGYSEGEEEKSTAQFDISDDRDVAEIVKMIKNKGYQPLFKDWEIV